LSREDLFDVAGRVVVVTGGLGQLGRQFAAALAERGANVALFDLAAAADPLAGFDPSLRERLLYARVDVTDRQSIALGLELVIGRWGVPFGLINNAALDSPPDAPVEENGPFESYPESSWDRIMEVNVKGVFLCCQVVGARMADEGRGSIVNVSSIYGVVSPDQRIYNYRGSTGAPFFKPIAYSASKSALLNMTRYLATYWGAHGVRVNTVTFAGVANQQDERFLSGYLPRVPLGRMARAAEYNGAVVFLMSDAASYMTGSNMIIDGGWTAW
jgi:NAD(P)-dependent dehydrogenase (short-subunit alcohol dehydrogenase family)